MNLIDYITIDRILPEMRSTTKKDALLELAHLVAGDDEERGQHIAGVLSSRERLASTAIGDEIAIPHGKLDEVGTLIVALGRSSAGLDFESVDGKPTRLFFVLLAPESSTGIHLKALARISRLCKEPGFRSRLLQVADASAIYEILRQEDEKYAGR